MAAASRRRPPRLVDLLVRKLPPPYMRTGRVRPLGIDRYGLRLRVEDHTGDRDVWMPFANPVDDAPALSRAIRMLVGCLSSTASDRAAHQTASVARVNARETVRTWLRPPTPVPAGPALDPAADAESGSRSRSFCWSRSDSADCPGSSRSPNPWRRRLRSRIRRLHSTVAGRHRLDRPGTPIAGRRKASRVGSAGTLSTVAFGDRSTCCGTDPPQASIRARHSTGIRPRRCDRSPPRSAVLSRGSGTEHQPHRPGQCARRSLVAGADPRTVRDRELRCRRGAGRRYLITRLRTLVGARTNHCSRRHSCAAVTTSIRGGSVAASET